jgi:hypothetical protein
MRARMLVWVFAPCTVLFHRSSRAHPRKCKRVQVHENQFERERDRDKHGGAREGEREGAISLDLHLVTVYAGQCAFVSEQPPAFLEHPRQ